MAFMNESVNGPITGVYACGSKSTGIEATYMNKSLFEAGSVSDVCESESECSVVNMDYMNGLNTLTEQNIGGSCRLGKLSFFTWNI